jgi:PST family polysaccharide transporter
LLVIVIFGQKWLPLVPLLKIFAGYCILRTICTIIAQLLEGIGNPKEAAKIVSIEFIILTIAILTLLSYGIIGVAIAVIFARCISMILYLHKINQKLGISLFEYVLLLWKKILASFIMGVFVFLLKIVFSEPTFFNLIVLVSVGAGIYLGILWYFDRTLIDEGKQMINKIV